MIATKKGKYQLAMIIVCTSDLFNRFVHMHSLANRLKPHSWLALNRTNNVLEMKHFSLSCNWAGPLVRILHEATAHSFNNKCYNTDYLISLSTDSISFGFRTIILKYVSWFQCGAKAKNKSHLLTISYKWIIHRLLLWFRYRVRSFGCEFYSWFMHVNTSTCEMDAPFYVCKSRPYRS